MQAHLQIGWVERCELEVCQSPQSEVPPPGLASLRHGNDMSLSWRTRGYAACFRSGLRSLCSGDAPGRKPRRNRHAQEGDTSRVRQGAVLTCRRAHASNVLDFLTLGGTAANIKDSQVHPISPRPRRLARPRTSPFHGGNTGSNPVGDANKINTIPRPNKFSSKMPHHLTCVALRFLCAR
jgi:hypothetical protein